MRHRQHTDHAVSRMDKRQVVIRKLCIAPQTTERDHNPFGETGGPGGIIQYSQFFRLFCMIFYISRSKRTGIFLSEIFIDPVAYHAYILVLTFDDGEIIQHHEQFHIGHHLFVHILPVICSCQDGFGSRVIDDMVDVVRFEFVQDRDGYGSIRQDAEEADRPVGRVTPHQSHFVSLLDPCMFEYYMKFFYTAGHVFIMVRVSIIIRESGKVPMFLDAVLDKS